MRTSTVSNRLLSRTFCDDFGVPELAHLSPHRECDATASIAPGIQSHRTTPARRHPLRHKSTARRAGSPPSASLASTAPQNQQPSPRSHRTAGGRVLLLKLPSARRKTEKRLHRKGEARLIDPCDASARQGYAHGDGLRRPTGESPHRSSRRQGAASMPLDPPPPPITPRSSPPRAVLIHPQTTRSPGFWALLTVWG